MWERLIVWLQVACTQFINIIVHSVEDVNFRVHLQHEFSLLGLEDYLVVWRLCFRLCYILRTIISRLQCARMYNSQVDFWLLIRGEVQYNTQGTFRLCGMLPVYTIKFCLGETSGIVKLKKNTKIVFKNFNFSILWQIFRCFCCYFVSASDFMKIKNGVNVT